MNTMNIRISSNSLLTAEHFDKLFEAIHTFGAIDEGFDPQFILIDSSDSAEEPCDCEASEEPTCECHGGCCRKLPEEPSDMAPDEAELANFISDVTEEMVNQKFKEDIHPFLKAFMMRNLKATTTIVDRIKQLNTRLKEVETKMSEILFKTKPATDIPVAGVTERRGRKAKRQTDKDC